MKQINKHVYTWVGACFFGVLGVNRFMRGQTGLGLLKLFTFGLGGILALIDWIIALVKLGKYEKDFVFDYNGKWDESYTTEALEKAAKEKAERELREKEWEKQEKERLEKYKKDILSGAISYDEELKKAAAVEEEYLKYKSYFLQKVTEASSLVKEFTDQTKTGDWDTTWYRITVDKIKDIRIDYPSFNTAILSDLLEVKWDTRVSNLKNEIEKLVSEYQNFNNELNSYQFRLRNS